MSNDNRFEEMTANLKGFERVVNVHKDLHSDRLEIVSRIALDTAYDDPVAANIVEKFLKAAPSNDVEETRQLAEIYRVMLVHDCGYPLDDSKSEDWHNFSGPVEFGHEVWEIWTTGEDHPEGHDYFRTLKMLFRDEYFFVPVRSSKMEY